MGAVILDGVHHAVVATWWQHGLFNDVADAMDLVEEALPEAYRHAPPLAVPIDVTLRTDPDGCVRVVDADDQVWCVVGTISDTYHAYGVFDIHPVPTRRTDAVCDE